MLLVSYNNIKASRDACILGHQLSLQAYTDMSSSLPVFTFLSWRNNQTPIQQPGSFGLSSLPLNSLVSLEIWNCSPNLGHTIIGKLGLTPCGPCFYHSHAPLEAGTLLLLLWNNVTLGQWSIVPVRLSKYCPPKHTTRSFLFGHLAFLLGFTWEGGHRFFCTEISKLI